METSPSLVYGAALLMRFGLTAHPGFESRSLRPAVELCFPGNTLSTVDEMSTFARHSHRVAGCNSARQEAAEARRGRIGQSDRGHGPVPDRQAGVGVDLLQVVRTL